MHEKVALKGAREEKTRGEEEQRQLFARARVDQQWQKESSSIGWTEKRERESAGRGFAQRERRLVLFHPRPAAKRCDAKLDFSNSASILARTIETTAQLPFSSVLSLSLVRRSLARARTVSSVSADTKWKVRRRGYEYYQCLPLDLVIVMRSAGSFAAGFHSSRFYG